MKKAIIIFSGGLDSTTCLAIAMRQGFECYAISFDYGQRHKIELEFAKKIVSKCDIKEHKIVEIDLRIFGKSSLTGDINVPKGQILKSREVPSTYVPARNTIFLSYALAYAETTGASDIFIGVNAVDFSNYPDCRPDYINAFEKLASLACASDAKIKIHAPLINLNKKEIIETGLKLGIDYSQTYSCYDPKIIGEEIYSCGNCDSCNFRLQGFKQAGLRDEIKY